MNYYTIPPSPQLAPYVRFFWVFESGEKPAAPYVYRSMADGCAEILFHYRGVFEDADEPGVKQSYSLVHAQTQRFRRFETKDNFSIFGVYLYPDSIPRLFNLPSTDLSNQMPDLASLIGREGKELEEKMMLAENNSCRVRILSSFLEKRLATKQQLHHGVHAAIRYIIHMNFTLNVQQLAEKSCLSARQFERRFKEESGFSPKLYSRIIRFQSALNAYEKNSGKSLTGIAYECGYFDQAHFINDFREFSGYVPRQYFAGKPEGIEWRDA
jgi:AraC-like DNA-binding protein